MLLCACVCVCVCLRECQQQPDTLVSLAAAVDSENAPPPHTHTHTHTHKLSNVGNVRYLFVHHFSASLCLYWKSIANGQINNVKLCGGAFALNPSKLMFKLGC